MKEKIKNLLIKMEEDHVSEFSAESSYYIILAFVPFLILLLSLVQFTGIEPQTIYNILSQIIPNTMKDMLISIVQEVFSKSYGTISIAILFTLWSAGKGLYALNKGLNNIYEIEEDGYIYLKAKSILNTIIFLILITITMVFLVFGSSFIKILKNQLIIFDSFFWELVAKITQFMFVFLVYIVIYKFIPKHKVKISTQIPGAFIGAIGLNIVSFIFSQYLNIFKGFSVMYGSLTTIMLILMWTYTCMYTLFLGAEINKNRLFNKNK